MSLRLLRTNPRFNPASDWQSIVEPRAAATRARGDGDPGLFVTGTMRAHAGPFRYVLSIENMVGADLRGADLSNSYMLGCSFDGANLQGADFSRSNLIDSSFQRAALRGAKFADAFLGGVDFTTTDLSGVDFRGAVFDEYTRRPAGFDFKAAGAFRGVWGQEALAIAVAQMEHLLDQMPQSTDVRAAHERLRRLNDYSQFNGPWWAGLDASIERAATGVKRAMAAEYRIKGPPFYRP